MNNSKNIESENMALRMLTNINQAIVHATDEKSLLQKACKIISEYGVYKVVMIFLKEGADANSLIAVAHSDLEVEGNRVYQVPFDGTEKGLNPIGETFQTGEITIVNTISEKMSGIKLYAKVVESGCNSVLALPLIRENKTFGVLAIFSNDKNSFSEDETRIVVELSKDLSFGISSLRTKGEHSLVEEELLHASADRYKSLFLSSRDAIMTLEPPEWKFTSGNPATVKMFGFSSEADFLLHEPWALSPEFQPDGRRSDEKAKEMIEKAMSEGSNLFEWTHNRANGEDFPAEVLLSKVEDGKKYLHALVRDITERKKLEEKVKEYAEEKFKIIFDSTNDGIALVDIDKKSFSTANIAFCKMLGYSTEEVLRLSVSDIHTTEDLPYIFEQFEKHVNGETSKTIDVRVRRKNGSIFYCDTSSSPVLLENKKYLLVVFRDVSDRKEAEKKEKEYIEGIENMNKLMIGRELKMVELKNEIESLKNKLNIK